MCGGCESPAGLEVVVRSYALSGFDAFVTDSQDQLGQQLGLCRHLIGCQRDEKISVELLCAHQGSVYSYETNLTSNIADIHS